MSGHPPGLLTAFPPPRPEPSTSPASQCSQPSTISVPVDEIHAWSSLTNSTVGRLRISPQWQDTTMVVVLLGMVVAAVWGVNGVKGLLTEDRQVRRP